MTLRKRTAIIVGVAMASVVSMLFAVGWGIVGRGFDELETEYAERDAERVIRAIEREVEQLEVMAVDWATWDDTYAFVQGQDDEYEGSNLGADTMVGLDLDLLAIVDLNGGTAYAESIEREDGTPAPFPAGLAERIAAGGDLAGHGIAGVVIVDGAPLLAGIRPILQSDGSGPVAGTLVMARWLDDSLLAELSERTVASASLVELDEDPGLAARIADHENHLTQVLNDDQAATYSLLATLDGDSSLGVQTITERDITAKGRNILGSLAFLLGLAGVAFAVVTFLLLEVGVVRRLHALGKAVHTIGSRADIRGRLGMGGPDELGRLSEDIDLMLDSLDRAEQRYRNLVEQAADGIVILREGKIGFANPAARGILQLEGEQDDELSLQSFMDADDREAFERTIAWLQPGDSARLETRVYLRPGTVRVVELGMTGLEGGEVQVLMRDNTDKVRAAREQQEMERQMLEAQRLESLGLLAGGIAHDFNNLLMVVLGNATLARSYVVDDRGSGVFDELETAAARAAELTQQLLAFAGRGQQRPAVLDLSVLAQETATMVRRVAGKQAVVEVDCDKRSPVEADPTQVRQVVLNLLTNAVDALPEGRGAIAIATGSATLEGAAMEAMQVPPAGTAPEGWVYVEVSDDGVGMEDEVRARMFEPFYSTKGDGRGLGLAATIGIMRSTGGGVDVRSAPGKGTTIRVYFPRAAAAEDKVGAGAAAGPSATTGGPVMVVDDDNAVRRVAARFLELAGYEVTQCASGSEALDLLEADQDYRVVVLDVTMPQVDGLEVLRRLRESGVETPIVLMSGFSREALPTDHGALFLQKPFEASQLVDAVAAAQLTPAA